ncbi:MAG: AraC family transcriptional regulator [Phenylobacterium sp.]|uniref:AraC family transcriptional regulator n=1 Tax=Phenylobacterium sp. TaxID=1871053 RepID=UPI001A4614B8|nr:helix-turn-helix domain-containing protein [Phenylobacterium sp.]MBL8770055.1 AraC family transcriptional regulator [Phenylobacterium sp.]
MSESVALISAFVHGLAAGAMLVVCLVVWRSGLNPHIRLATLLVTASIMGMAVNESRPLWAAMGEPAISLVLAAPVAGLLWLFILTVFADWRITPLTLAPAAVLLVTGVIQPLVQDDAVTGLWGARNLFSAILAVHAGVLILRGWSDDLVERRRRLRAVVLSLACLFVVVQVSAGFAFRLSHDPGWLDYVVGRPIGGVVVAALALGMASVALTVQPTAFGAAARRIEASADPRADAADRGLVEQLNATMAQEIWRREGLTIGGLASELGVPEHRLRRLINQRLGYRNFADFLNGRRIEAAKRRLSDPAEARTTIAAVAFDLGFGSLGPFNRAFRNATGSTPTEWRRAALAAAGHAQEPASLEQQAAP